MKTTIISSIFKIGYYLVLIKNMPTGTHVENNQCTPAILPFFSYKKDDFSEFEFTFADDQVNHETLMNSPFGSCTPLGNFFETFCLFYQHSKVKNDEEFKKKLSNFFDSCHERDEESVYEHVNFDLYFEHQVERIKEILDEKDASKQVVSFEEKRGKIICKLNNNFKSVQDEDQLTKNPVCENELKNNMINFFTKYNEMYLQGLLGKDFYGALNIFFDEYEEKVANLPFDSNHPHVELLALCLEIDKTLRFNNKELADESEEVLLSNCKEQIISFFNKYSCLIISRHSKRNVPDSIIELIPKVAAKVLYNISDNQYIFSLQSSKYKNDVIALIEYLKTSFEGKNLSEKSIENLVIFCLEWDV